MQNVRLVDARRERRIVYADQRVASPAHVAAESRAMGRAKQKPTSTVPPRDASGMRARFDALDALISEPSDPARKLSVLVVEDDEAIREALGILLAEEYEVTCVERLAEARAILRSNPPALVVLDLGLRGEHGSELLAELAFVDEAPPVLVLSASRDAADVARDYDVAYMRKPFDVPRLLAAIGSAIVQGARPRRAVAAR